MRLQSNPLCGRTFVPLCQAHAHTAIGHCFFPAAFKFGRRVYCALRRKMQKPRISRVPAILNGLTNRQS